MWCLNTPNQESRDVSSFGVLNDSSLRRNRFEDNLGTQQTSKCTLLAQDSEFEVADGLIKQKLSKKRDMFSVQNKLGRSESPP